MSAGGFGRTVPAGASRPAPATATAMQMRCLVGDVPGEVHVLPDRARLTVGRGDPTNGVRVEVDLSPQETSKPVASVSREHAEIEWLEDRPVVRDLGSRNGTFVNEKRLEPLVSVPLEPGHRIRFGAVEFKVEVGGGQ